MNILIKFVISSLLIVLCCCTRQVEYVRLAEEKMFLFAREVKQTDNLDLAMYGGGFYEHINSLSIGFVSREITDINSARNLYLSIAHRFLEAVNTDIGLRKYLSVHPFTIEELELIIFYEPRDEYYAGPYISSVGMGEIIDHARRDFIIYTQFDSLTDRSEAVLMESYQKALETVRYQQCCQDMRHELIPKQ